MESQFQEIFDKFGKNSNTLEIQVIYAEFLSFKRNNPEKSISILTEALKQPLTDFQTGILKTKLADILVFSNKFNTALIHYTQVQKQLKKIM